MHNKIHNTLTNLRNDNKHILGKRLQKSLLDDQYHAGFLIK